MKIRNILSHLALFVFALLTPSLLMLKAWQSGEFRKCENEILALEQKQEDLVEDNKKIIANISRLSSSDRIERIATEELGMREALSKEIIRVEMTQHDQ